MVSIETLNFVPLDLLHESTLGWSWCDATALDWCAICACIALWRERRFRLRCKTLRFAILSSSNLSFQISILYLNLSSLSLSLEYKIIFHSLSAYSFIIYIYIYLPTRIIGALRWLLLDSLAKWRSFAQLVEDEQKRLVLSVSTSRAS